MSEPLYKKVECEHGHMKPHRAPERNSYLATYLCPGGTFVPVEVVVGGCVSTIIDYEAAVEFALSEVEKGLVFTEEEYEQAMRTQVHGIVNAALNVEEDS